VPMTMKGQMTPIRNGLDDWNDSFLAVLARLKPGVSIEQAQAHVDLSGASLSPGDDVWIVLPAANRDPARFPDPDVFRLDRPPDQRHLSFSAGPHHCLGAALGRLELTVLLEVLGRRLPGAELADQELEWRDTVFFRGVRSLRIAPRG